MIHFVWLKTAYLNQELSFRLNIWPSPLPTNISLPSLHGAYYEIRPVCSVANNISLEFLFQ